MRYLTKLKYVFITDEHRSFDKLKSDYNLNIYKFFAHLIRSMGPHSALKLFLRDILNNDIKKNMKKII